jgi:hypothetical protein
MMDLEHELSEMLAEKAGRISSPPMQHTLRRVKVRRALTVGIAGAAVVGLFVAGGAMVRLAAEDRSNIGPSTDESSSPEIGEAPLITTEGPYGFTSALGEFPTIASGEFQDAQWELTSETITEDQIDSVRLTLSVTTGEGDVISTQQDVLAGDDTLMMKQLFLDGRVGAAPPVDVVFGATTRNVDSVTVEVADGEELSIPAHFYTHYDSHSNITAHYYLAFIPAEAPGGTESRGFVIARDELGIDLDEEPYGRVSRAPRVVVSGVSDEDIRWGVMFGGLGDQGCIVFQSAEEGSECYPRERFDANEPLLMTVFDRTDVKGVTAVVGSDVGSVRLEVDGEEPVVLPWFSVRDSGPTWSLRMVAVALEPSTTGRLVALDGTGDVIAEESF